jgi:peptidoglycan/LPS O-acetylase OafA/YrhL
VVAPKTNQIIGIDLIRFFAASIVMLFHLCYWIWAGGPFATTPAAAKAAIQFPELAFFRYGLVGVDIFFVVSGFIIAYSASNATAYEFGRSRVVRLMPAIWIVAPITLAGLFGVEFASPMKLIAMFVRSVLL